MCSKSIRLLLHSQRKFPSHQNYFFATFNVIFLLSIPTLTLNVKRFAQNNLDSHQSLKNVRFFVLRHSQLAGL